MTWNVWSPGSGNTRGEIDGVLIYDEDGFIVADLPLFDLIAYPDEYVVADVLDAEGHPPPLTVGADADVREVAEQLVRTRRACAVGSRPRQRAIGRILADDVLDALLPDRGRLHFPRLLS